jgi:hypothetical protein
MGVNALSLLSFRAVGRRRDQDVDNKGASVRSTISEDAEPPVSLDVLSYYHNGEVVPGHSRVRECEIRVQLKWHQFF